MNRNPLLDSDGTATGLKPSFVKTLGTGAADHEWNRLVEPGVRGSACTLIDGHILVDFGITDSPTWPEPASASWRLPI